MFTLLDSRRQVRVGKTFPSKFRIYKKAYKDGFLSSFSLCLATSYLLDATMTAAQLGSLGRVESIDKVFFC